MIYAFALLSAVALGIALLGEYKEQQRLHHMADEVRNRR